MKIEQHSPGRVSPGVKVRRVVWDAQVYSSVWVWAPWCLRMGHRACLGPGVVCYNQDWVVLDDVTVVEHRAYLGTAGHDVDRANTATAGLVTAPHRAAQQRVGSLPCLRGHGCGNWRGCCSGCHRFRLQAC